MTARKRADAVTSSTRARDAMVRTILAEQQISWIGDRPAAVRLIAVMEQLPAVEKWRGTLTDLERVKWAAPQSVWNKCPIFHDGKEPPKRKLRPMSVNELIKMPGAQAAQLLVDRSPQKAWAIRRALDELLDKGTVAQRASPTVRTRRSEEADASVAA